MPRNVPRVSPRIAISIAFLLRGFIQGSWYPRIPGVTEKVDVDPATLGTIFFLFALGNIVAFNIASKVVLRVGSPRTHAIYAIPFPLAIIGIGYATTPIQFGIGMFVFGLLNGGYDIASSVQGGVVERQTSRPILSTLFGLFSVGALLGSFSSGLLTQTGVSIPFQFASIGVVSIVLSVAITSCMLPDDTVSVSAPTVRKERRRPLLPPKVLIPLGLTIVCIALGEETVNNWVALYLRDDLGTSPAVASWAFTAFAIATASGRLVGDAVIARIGLDRMLTIGVIAAAAGVGSGMLINTPWAIILGYTIMGLGLAVVVPVTYRRANHVPGIPPATAVATVASIGFIGFLFGPLLVGSIAALTSLRLAISAVAMVLLGILILAKMSSEKERTL